MAHLIPQGVSGGSLSGGSVSATPTPPSNTTPTPPDNTTPTPPDNTTPIPPSNTTPTPPSNTTLTPPFYVDAPPYNTKIASGGIYSLGKWTGYTLRKLVYSNISSRPFHTRIQIATSYPQSGLNPFTNAIPNALFDVLIFGGTSDSCLRDLDFPPNLITVLPGETLYIIVFDHMAGGKGSALWTLNMLWEPIDTGGKR